MNPIYVSGAAAALLLYFGGRKPSDLPVLVAELRSALDGELLGAVDRWAHEGPDTEQLLCLADLLDRRAQDDPVFRERVRRTVLAGREALSALDELAGRLGRAGLEQGRQWCLARAADLGNSIGTDARVLRGGPSGDRAEWTSEWTSRWTTPHEPWGN